jgi:hypothetical protein
VSSLFLRFTDTVALPHVQAVALGEMAMRWGYPYGSHFAIHSIFTFSADIQEPKKVVIITGHSSAISTFLLQLFQSLSLHGGAPIASGCGNSNRGVVTALFTRMFVAYAEVGRRTALSEQLTCTMSTRVSTSTTATNPFSFTSVPVNHDATSTDSSNIHTIAMSPTSTSTNSHSVHSIVASPTTIAITADAPNPISIAITTHARSSTATTRAYSSTATITSITLVVDGAVVTATGINACVHVSAPSAFCGNSRMKQHGGRAHAVNPFTGLMEAS